MIDINFFKNSWFFEKKTLKKWEYLFCEWEVDENIYIIITWELLIEKFTNQNKDEAKVLASLKKDDVFWEASLNNNLPKQVSIKANKKTDIIYINAISGLRDFSSKYPNESFDLLKYIIHLSNNRLNESNSLITASYKISSLISNINDFSFKTIFQLIEETKILTGVKDIIFLEENQVLKEYLTIKYNTSQPWLMQDQIIKITDNKLDLLELKSSWEYIYIQNIKVWNKNYWYLVFLRKWNDFSENEIKIISVLGVSFSSIIKQKEFIEEQRNKDYIKNRV